MDRLHVEAIDECLTFFESGISPDKPKSDLIDFDLRKQAELRQKIKTLKIKLPEIILWLDKHNKTPKGLNYPVLCEILSGRKKRNRFHVEAIEFCLNRYAEEKVCQKNNVEPGLLPPQ